jgi:hypothetical protein
MVSGPPNTHDIVMHSDILSSASGITGVYPDIRSVYHLVVTDMGLYLDVSASHVIIC